MAVDLNHHHRVTLEKIFNHPLSGNVEWRQVLSLLGAVGTTTQEPNGKVKVSSAARPRSCNRQTTRTSTDR